MTVCNLNQMEASLLKKLGFYDNQKMMNNFTNTFFGSQGNANFLGAGGIIQLPRQKCKNLFVSMNFRGKSLNWNNLPKDENTHSLVGPSFYATDFGACCLFVPHVDFEGFDMTKNLTYSEHWRALDADSLNGETNGEANLSYLPFSKGYGYEMNNCLIDQIIGEILWKCGCRPSFYKNSKGLENLT